MLPLICNPLPHLAVSGSATGLRCKLEVLSVCCARYKDGFLQVSYPPNLTTIPTLKRSQHTSPDNMQIQAVTLFFAISTLCVFTDKGVAAGGVQWLSGKSYQDYCSGSAARQGATQHVCFSGKEAAEFSDSSHFTGILSGNKRGEIAYPAPCYHHAHVH